MRAGEQQMVYMEAKGQEKRNKRGGQKERGGGEVAAWEQGPCCVLKAAAVWEGGDADATHQPCLPV